jgi:hypothetical protein
MNARPPRTTSRLLIHEPALQVLPSLAVAIGLNEAIFLQQLHYWLVSSKHEHEGRRWVYNSLDEWKKQLPFFGLSTIRRTIDELRKSGLLLVGNFNPSKSDRTLWYSIDYDMLAAIEDLPPSAGIDMPSVQNEQMEVSKMEGPSVQNEHMLIEHKTTPETTQSGGVAKPSQTTPPPQGQRESDEALKQYGYDAGQRRKIYAARLPLTDQEIADLPEYIAALKRAGKRNPIGIVYNELIDGKSIPHPEDVAPTEAPLEYTYTDDGRAIPKDPERHARIQAQRKAQLAAAGYR